MNLHDGNDGLTLINLNCLKENVFGFNPSGTIFKFPLFRGQLSSKVAFNCYLAVRFKPYILLRKQKKN